MTPIIAAVYGLMSLFTFVAYYLDKRAACLHVLRGPDLSP